MGRGTDTPIRSKMFLETLPMEYHEWNQAYETLLQTFGYSRRADERSRDWLADYCRTAGCAGSLPAIDGETVAVVGGASLSQIEAKLTAADAIIAASDAGPRLAAAGHRPDLVVTDLDGDPDGVRQLAADGIPVAVHAHGDNQATLETVLPAFPAAAIVPTTQAPPSGPVKNYGGFTDGDRGAFIADHCGASRLVFPGWDFDDPTLTAEKSQKLEWAARLLYWLETRRDEQFDLLDGRRGRLDYSWESPA